MKFLLPLISIPIILFYLFNDDRVLAEKIAQSLEQWNTNYPQEKVYVQIDKKQLVAGDDIWFKAVCTYNGKPSFLSRIVYVDIVNEKSEVIAKKMLRLDSLSTANGVFSLSKELLSGNYSINAYTLWMLNFPDFIHKTPVYIYGKDYITKIKQKQKASIGIQFFPEGGTFVEGIKNKMAFKITDQSGMPVQIMGSILNKQGTVVAEIVSNTNGMGNVEIETEVGQQYTANIKSATGAVFSYKLPTLATEGVHLTVSNTKNRIFALINRSEKNKDKYNNLLLAAHINGQLVFVGAFNVDEGKTATAIPKKGLPAGIMHITVFDTLANPLAERLVFVDNYTLTKPSIQFSEKSNLKRGKNNWTFSVDSLQTNSISILVKSTTTDNAIFTDENIASSILLSSDIKGTVTNPGSYFINKADSTLQQLDLLLLTHGWRKFIWNDVLAKKELSLKYPIESTISIKGKVTKSDRDAIITNGKVSMIIRGEDSTKIMADAYLTDKGEFIVDSLNFREKATVFYEGQNNKKEKLQVDVTIYKAYIDTLKSSNNRSGINLDTSDISNRKNTFAELMYKQLAVIDTLTFGMANLAEVVVTTKKLSRIDSLQKEYVTTAFEMSDQTIDFKDAKGMINIWQYLQMQISGFDVQPFSGGATARFTRFDAAAGLSQDIAENGIEGILFMLNEIPVDAIFLDNILPEEVALVKVYKGNTAFPWGANRGMIAVYTKKGADLKTPWAKSFNKMEIMGYANSREFYNPNYEKYPLLLKNSTDKRQTLFWQPNAKPINGKYSISFFNNDISNSYKLVIQGIDKTGKLVLHEQIID